MSPVSITPSLPFCAVPLIPAAPVSAVDTIGQSAIADLIIRLRVARDSIHCLVVKARMTSKGEPGMIIYLGVLEMTFF